MKLSTLITGASFATISVADAKRFAGRSLYDTTEGLAERRLEEFEMSIPMPTEESPADNIEKNVDGERGQQFHNFDRYESVGWWRQNDGR